MKLVLFLTEWCLRMWCDECIGVYSCEKQIATVKLVNTTFTVANSSVSFTTTMCVAHVHMYLGTS